MNVHDILRNVARAHRVKIEDIRSRRRQQYLVDARVAFIKQAASRNLTNGQIGRVINRTAWTVRHFKDDAVRDRKLARQRERRYARATMEAAE
jgi:chromosomal replication initiation ATPase DnaA